MEEIFGWMKTVGGLRRTRYRGVTRTRFAGYLVAAAYNLIRLARLIPKPATSRVDARSRGARWRRARYPQVTGREQPDLDNHGMTGRSPFPTPLPTTKGFFSAAC